VLALLALASFPLAAGASEIPQYVDAPPEAPTKPKKQSHDETEPETPAHTSNTGDGGSAGPGGSGGSGGSGGEGSSGGGSSEATNPNPSTDGSGGADKAGGGNAATGQSKSGSVQNAQPVVSPAEADDSSSSPLVPILIAVAILAAISIGAVVLKQRRQRGEPDGAVSPKAS
jgi:cobalamin biosynthesis Mg chelatase CobN